MHVHVCEYFFEDNWWILVRKFSSFIMQYHLMFASLVYRLMAKKKTYISRLSTQYSNVISTHLSPSLSIFQTLNFWWQSHAKFLTESISSLPPLTAFRFKTFSKQTIITKRKSRNRLLSCGIDCTSGLSIRWGPRCSMEQDDAIDKDCSHLGHFASHFCSLQRTSFATSKFCSQKILGFILTLLHSRYSLKSLKFLPLSLWYR